MADIANFIAQNSPRFNRAAVDRSHYQNALVRNQVDRLPQQNRAQDLAIQGAEQSIGAEQRKTAAGLLANRFAAVATASDPIRAAQSFIGGQDFQAAGRMLKLPVDQFTVTPNDNPQELQARAREWAQALGMSIGGGEAFTLSPGEARYGANGQLVASAAPPPGTDGGFTLSEGQTRYDASGKPLANVPKAPNGNGFDQAAKLRAEFNSQTSTFRSATEGYRSVLAAAKNPSAAGDIALIMSFMKTLDPNSTVREGEFATAQNAGGVPDRVRAQYNSILNGQRLSPDQRQDFVSQATQLYNGQRQGFDAISARYTDLAIRAGLSPQDVIGLSTGVETSGVDIPQDGASFTTEAEAAAAAQAGRIRSGQRIVVGGVSGVWQ